MRKFHFSFKPSETHSPKMPLREQYFLQLSVLTGKTKLTLAKTRTTPFPGKVICDLVHKFLLSFTKIFINPN